MSGKASEESDDEDDFKFSRPSNRCRKTIQQNRQPVEHDEKTEGPSALPLHSDIEITEEASKLHYESIVSCKAGKSNDLFSKKSHQNYLRRLAQSLGQVVYGTPEAVAVVVDYWSDIKQSRQRNDKTTIYTMEVGSEGVLLNHALHLRREQQYHYPDHYDRLTTSISSGQFSICSTESIRPLGIGQYGKVYQAVDGRTGQRFAEKIIQLENFSPNELEILCQLDHQHVIKLYGVIRSRTSDIHILMQYGGGGNLQQLLQEGKGFVCSRNGLCDYIFADYWSTYYFRHTLLALDYLQSKNIVHCDVKLRNIVLSSDRRTAFLTDFGEARVINPSLGYIELSSIVGTMHYISPEVIDQRKYYFESDLWSVACCLLHCLTGRSPWTSLYPDLATYLIVIAKRPFEIIEEIPSWCSRLTQSILRSSFQKVKDRKLIKELLQLTSNSLSILDKKSRTLDPEVSSSVESFSLSLPESSTASAQEHADDAHSIPSGFNNSNNTPQKVESPCAEDNLSVVDGQLDSNHVDDESYIVERSASVEPLSISMQFCIDPVQAPQCSSANYDNTNCIAEENCSWKQDSDPDVVAEMIKLCEEYSIQSVNDHASMCELLKMWKKYSEDDNDQSICDELNGIVQTHPPFDENQIPTSNENDCSSDE